MLGIDESTVQAIVRSAALVMEFLGVLTVVLGSFFSGGRYLWCFRARPEAAYTGLRRGLGRAILLGLEFLVAADIIRTVAIEPSFRSAGVLGLVVLIRTFLSVSLEVEINGHWPWRRAHAREK